MDKRAVFAMLVAMAIVWTIGNPTTVTAAQPGGAGPHYELKIGGFAQCKMDPNAPGTYPDCFNGNAGPGGHVIFVPLKTAQENVCQVGTTLPNPITVADLLKGVRILVTDGPDLDPRQGCDGRNGLVPDPEWLLRGMGGGEGQARRVCGHRHIDLLRCCTLLPAKPGRLRSEPGEWPGLRVGRPHRRRPASEGRQAEVYERDQSAARYQQLSGEERRVL